MLSLCLGRAGLQKCITKTYSRCSPNVLGLYGVPADCRRDWVECARALHGASTSAHFCSQAAEMVTHPRHSQQKGYFWHL